MAIKNYIPQNWEVGDIITAEKVNNIEQALFNIDENLIKMRKFYNEVNELLTDENEDKVLAIKNSILTVDTIENLLIDGDNIKY